MAPIQTSALVIASRRIMQWQRAVIASRRRQWQRAERLVWWLGRGLQHVGRGWFDNANFCSWEPAVNHS